MWKIRRYGKSYIYDRLHRAFVAGIVVLGTMTIAQVFIVIHNGSKTAPEAQSKQQKSLQSGTTEDNVKNAGNH